MTMKAKNLYAAILALGAITPCRADLVPPVSDLTVDKTESALTVSYTVNADSIRLKSTRMVRLTPVVKSATDTVELTPVDIAGRRAWYYEARSGGNTALLRAGKHTSLPYSCSVPMQEWMQNCEVSLRADTLDDCRCRIIGSGERPLASVLEANMQTMRKALPAFRYEAPLDTAPKRFNLSGKANIIFIVNKTDIDWRYRNNRAELDTIIKTIAVVRDNPDATVESITLTGYASPEGPYDNNVRLAEGRTEAVKEYVRERGTFPPEIYRTSSVPEDWDGLRDWLANNHIPFREEMIKYIDEENVRPEDRNDVFAKWFPHQYPWLLENVYPTLRHTDYKITYVIRQYLDVEEIKRVMKSNPGNLSQNELFMVAASLPEGSREREDVFDLAVRLFPDSDVANLNAANSAMNRGDLNGAERFLERAGDSPSAQYARGILKAMRGEYREAIPYLQQGADAGYEGAAQSIKRIERLLNDNGIRYY